MLPDKIKNFYEVRANYFKKKLEIAKAMCELDYLLHEANHALSDTIDNGFDNEYLVKVAKEYEMHKFGSKVVQEFLEKIDEMFFKDIDANLKDGLEIVSLDIDLDYCDRWEHRDARVNDPIKIYVSNAAAKRHFMITVPIKGAVSANMIQWNERKEGLYVLWVNAPNANISKEACCVFDYSKISSAIEKYLKGEFDEELGIDTYILDTMEEASNDKMYKYIYRPYLYEDDAFSNSSIDYNDGIKYIEQHDIFGQYGFQEYSFFNGWRESSSLKASNKLSNCIDDRCDYV